MSNDPIWQHAQEEETECWSGISFKLKNPKYFELKKEYWSKIIDKCGFKDQGIFENKSVLEIGCGPSGLFINFPDHPDYSLVEPLLDSYQQLAPLAFKNQKKHPIPFEDFKNEKKFNIVVCINAIDHCRNIENFIDKMYEVASTNSISIIGVNTHVYGWTARFWRKYQRLIDPMHPYQFTGNEYAKMLSKKFELISHIDVEDEVAWINNRTDDESFGKKPTVTKKSSRAFSKIIEAIQHGEFFAKLFKHIVHIFIPVHSWKDGARSIYRHKVFVLKKS